MWVVGFYLIAIFLFRVAEGLEVEENTPTEAQAPIEHRSLLSLYRTHEGLLSDKWAHFPIIYEDILLPLYSKAVQVEHARQQSHVDNNTTPLGRRPRLLELGVQNGGSLQLLNRYFHGLVDIMAMDIDANVNKLIEQTELGRLPNIHIVIGNASDADTIRNTFGAPPDVLPPLPQPGTVVYRDSMSHFVVDSANLNAYPERRFDLIIDDASHINMEVIITFDLLFMYLQPGGYYVVEDAHTSYIRQRFFGGWKNPVTIFKYFRALTDRINRHPFVDQNILGTHIHPEQLQKDIYFYQWLHSIEFIDGMIVIRKLKQPRPVHGYCRVIVGEIETVTNLGNRTWIPKYDTACLSLHLEL
jgi:hypothetical protein